MLRVHAARRAAAPWFEKAMKNTQHNPLGLAQELIPLAGAATKLEGRQPQKHVMAGNAAAAWVAYNMAESAMIYPITPSSTMAEDCEKMMVKGVKNAFGAPTQVVQLESEAGAAGAMHGVLSAGGLATTFTSAQGLLLMIPNLYLMAGELLPGVLHVAARTVSTHGLSIFGDHSDVMACRGSGIAMLASCSVQEAMDLAAVAHMSAIAGRIPMMHFFDGFRVSHEFNTIEKIDADTLKELVPHEAAQRFRKESLNPSNPHMRGTSQPSEAFFQMAEATNTLYQAYPGIVKSAMARLEEVTGRSYDLFTYTGDPEATDVVVAMGSGVFPIKHLALQQNKEGKKFGVVTVHLFTPWSGEDFLAALPKSTERISVLDRCKEPGRSSEPLFTEVSTTLALENRSLETFRGRYGLSSKEFTPAMAQAVYDNMTTTKKKVFTVGITDDITNLSLEWGEEPNVLPPGTKECLFWGLGGDGTVGANKAAVDILANDAGKYAQGYFAFTAHKQNGITTSHLRFGDQKIDAPYKLTSASYIACHYENYIKKLGLKMIEQITHGGTFVINCGLKTTEELENAFEADVRSLLAEREVNLYTIDAQKVARDVGMPGRINTVMQSVFFELSDVLPKAEATGILKASIEKTYGSKGQDVVERNWKAVDQSLGSLNKIEVPASWASHTETDVETFARKHPYYADKFANLDDFQKRVQLPMTEQRGDLLPVSAFPLQGIIPAGTSQFEKRGLAEQVPIWEAKPCSQCNLCIVTCPHQALRICLVDAQEKKKAPKTFETAPAQGGRKVRGLEYRIQLAAEDCTGCNLCTDICPDDALEMQSWKEYPREQEQANFAFGVLDTATRDVTGLSSLKDSQFKDPLMEFCSGACSGCGETTVVGLIMRMYGSQSMIANSSGCSSVWASSYPNNPYTADASGKGPGWARSLFEDTAEFAFGMAKAAELRRHRAHALVTRMIEDDTDKDLKKALVAWEKVWTDVDKSATTAAKIEKLLQKMPKDKDTENIKALRADLDMLPRQVQWAIGGDGWAYDIGFNGLDHVCAQTADVNILILDNEVYSNTGGQMSKATPRSSVAKFATAGALQGKKDLARMMMTYGHVYVASICLGNSKMMSYTIKCIKEAVSYQGPSVTLAYTPCIEFGLVGGLPESLPHMEAVVKSGYWSLFSFDPRRAAKGQNPLVLNSDPPEYDLLGEVCAQQRRYVLTKDDTKLNGLKRDVKQRWDALTVLAEGAAPEASAAA